MKYKVGDKFLQEIEVAQIAEGDTCPYKMLPYGAGWSETALDDLRRPDDMTVEEAWEIARKIVLEMCDGGYGRGELKEIFETRDIMTIFKNNKTSQQAKAQIEAWEEKMNIKIGGVVKTQNSQKAIVFDIRSDSLTVWSQNGCVEEWRKSEVEKTDKHTDARRILEQIGGAE